MRYFFVCIFALSLLGICRLEATARLLTFHYNKPDFIELQKRTLDVFLKEDYELIVFNDASSQEMAEKICSTCGSAT